ncbi:MAG TPA: transglycosylase SLT domain-containing protein [Vicinamibacterales bacterium]|nr:transglycosylase SLT domain-containing protein [Vicinamibacterales bacterium]
MRRIPAALLFVIVLSGLGVIVTAATAPKPAPADPRYQKYDDYFKKYSKAYFSDGVDWTLFKAQGIVESNLRPDVESSEHAVGIMQLKRNTFEEVQRQLWQQKKQRLGDIKDPEANIAAGIWYDHEHWSYWQKKSDGSFHGHFMLGSYNAGRGHVIDAQAFAVAQKEKHPGQWPTIEKVAPKVPKWGSRSSETVAYVKGVFINIQSFDKKGQVVGDTISKFGSKVGSVGKSLEGQVNDWLHKFPHIVPWFSHHMPWHHDEDSK